MLQNLNHIHKQRIPDPRHDFDPDLLAIRQRKRAPGRLELIHALDLKRALNLLRDLELVREDLMLRLVELQHVVLRHEDEISVEAAAALEKETEVGVFVFFDVVDLGLGRRWLLFYRPSAASNCSTSPLADCTRRYSEHCRSPRLA